MFIRALRFFSHRYSIFKRSKNNINFPSVGDVYRKNIKNYIIDYYKDYKKNNLSICRKIINEWKNKTTDDIIKQLEEIEKHYDVNNKDIYNIKNCKYTIMPE